jgi:hypothetical protein
VFVRKVVLEIRFEEVIPKALSYEEAKLLASARGEERRRLMKLLLGEDGADSGERQEA